MIRPFAKSDFETYLAMSHEFYNSDATDHQVPEDHFRRTFEESVKGSPLARAWMVIDPGQPDEPAGYLLASITWGNEFGGRVSWLEELYLKEAARGKGLGRQALEDAMEELKTKDGVKGFRLEVAPANAAVSDLYRRMGFTKVPYDPWWLVL
ncbi:GNAT family N-acetyltransferase [Deltaproteobacteria bacterium OttesenSCG-928-K17]|nr:GNAT family N-acetyltransferase [Deltaproteobacteria bacterium OttesenSCG-928-K17]